MNEIMASYIQEVSKILEIIGNRQEEINDFWNRHFM